MTNTDERTTTLTPQEFAHLGGGAIAYVKTIRSEDAQPAFPAGAGDPAGLAPVRAARRRRHADHADRFQGRGDRQRLGAPARDGQRPLKMARLGAPPVRGAVPSRRESVRRAPIFREGINARLSRSIARSARNRRRQGRPHRHRRALAVRPADPVRSARGLSARHDQAAAPEVDRARADLVPERRHQHRLSQGQRRFDLGRMGGRERRPRPGLRQAMALLGRARTAGPTIRSPGWSARSSATRIRAG